MKLFHISDVLSVTTGRLVSSRHMNGVYEILDFLTGYDLFTHQLPDASQECEPWLRAQFPRLMGDSPEMQPFLARMGELRGDSDGIAAWVESVRVHFGLPHHIPVYELGADMHTRIDPIEELKAMVGDDRVIAVATDMEGRS